MTDKAPAIVRASSLDSWEPFFCQAGAKGQVRIECKEMVVPYGEALKIAQYIIGQARISREHDEGAQ